MDRYPPDLLNSPSLVYIARKRRLGDGTMYYSLRPVRRVVTQVEGKPYVRYDGKLHRVLPADALDKQLSKASVHHIGYYSLKPPRLPVVKHWLGK